MKLLALNSPEMSQHLWDRLNSAFPQIKPEPNITTLEEVMYNAGQRSIIAWLGQFVRSSVVTGEIDVK